MSPKEEDSLFPNHIPKEKIIPESTTLFCLTTSHNKTNKKGNLIRLKGMLSKLTTSTKCRENKGKKIKREKIPMTGNKDQYKSQRKSGTTTVLNQDLYRRRKNRKNIDRILSREVEDDFILIICACYSENIETYI